MMPPERGKTGDHGQVELDSWVVNTDLTRHELDGRPLYQLSVRVNGTFVGSYELSGRSAVSSVDPPRVIRQGSVFLVDGPEDWVR